MKQYEIIVMIPTQHFVTAGSIKEAKSRAESIRGGYDMAHSDITGDKKILPRILGIKEVEHDPFAPTVEEHRGLPSESGEVWPPHDPNDGGPDGPAAA